MPEKFTWADIEAAYLEATRGSDCPDVIWLMEGKCPQCCKVIEAKVIDECPHCGFPKRS